MRHVINDLEQTARRLIKQPGFAAVAVLTLALGIGANTAVFSVLNGVVLAPLPYDRPEELVRLYSATAKDPGDRNYLSVPDALDLRGLGDAFASVGILFTYRETGGDLAVPGGPPRRVRLLQVSADYFRTLHASPELGRTFAADEERHEATRVVLSHRLWRDIAALDPKVIDRVIDLDGRAYQVIGVMREGFRDVTGEDIAAWVPVDLTEAGPGQRHNHFLSAIARIKPGTTIAQAQSRINAMTSRLATEYQRGAQTKTLHAIPLLADVVGASRPSLFVLMGAAGLVLLIACLNVANLFLARSLGQTRDLAVRTALGANPARLIAERLGESLLVAVAGGAVGSLVAYFGVKLLLAVSPASLARADNVGFDPRLLGFALLTTVATGLLFGAAPAWRASRVDPTVALRDGSRGNSAGRGSRRVRDILVAAQVGVALILLAGAGTLMKAFMALQKADLGFVTDRVITFEVNLPPARYPDGPSRVRFHEAFAARLRGLPGIEQVGATSWLPANGHYHAWSYEAVAADGGEISVSAEVRVIDGDFFGALRIPVLTGRGFRATDGLDTAGVAVISRGLAERVYGARSPLGEPFGTGGRAFRVIGVVADVAQDVAGGVQPQIYLSHLQFASDRNWTMIYTVRAAAGASFIEPAKAQLAAVDPALVLFEPRPLEAVVARHRARERFTLLLMATFATVALSLAAIGLYGVMSYLVTQRGHEIGVRIALGARPAQVRGAVLKHGLLIAGGGMAVGLVGALALSRVLRSVVATSAPRDPMVFGSVLLVLGVVTLLAGYLPARRATRVDPLEALRSD